MSCPHGIDREKVYCHTCEEEARLKRERKAADSALRDQFAAAALVGLLSNPEAARGAYSVAEKNGMEPPLLRARMAYAHADAMLAAREEGR